MSSNKEITSIRFGKEYYHKHREMINWCEKHCGEGGWGVSVKRDEWDWSVDSMFGITTFFFRNESSLLMFTLKWL